MGTNWATVDVDGNIVPYTNFLVYTTGQVLHNITGLSTNNLLVDNTSTGDVVVDNDLAGTTTDVNTIAFDRAGLANNTGQTFSIIVGTNNTLRLGRTGGIFKVSTAGALTASIGSGIVSGGGGSNGVQNAGILTAGGPNDNTEGELIFTVNMNTPDRWID